MEYRYENIEHNSKIPIKIFTHTLEQFPYHWHEDMEILFVLKGNVEIFVDKEVTLLKDGDIFLINSNEIHYVKSTNYLEKSQLLALQFNKEYFNKFDIDLSHMQFKLNSRKDDVTNEKVYDKIRSILAMMMNVVINKEEPYELLINRYLLDLIIILVNKFTASEKGDYIDFKANENRLYDIVKYINENYKDSELTIPKIAGIFYLNPQYVSRYFKENIGVSIKGFIENLRLNRSLNDLKTTKDRVIDIAHRHGFPDEKSYYRVFKNVLGITPNKYREINSIEATKENKINYLNINSSEALSNLFEYLKPYDDIFEIRKSNHNINIIKADVVIDKLRDSWNKILTFGHAVYGLRNDFNKQLKTIQKDIGFQYIRFHGIFSDEMLLYNETSNGEVYYNFNHIDSLIDGFLENGIKPFIEIGFMPKKLATTKNKVFMWDCYVSAPKDIDKWLDMVDAFIKHILNRYGAYEVEKWYFEFWNEPNLETVFWEGTREEFFNFFMLTYKRIKSINSRLKVGGFGILKLGDLNTWIDEFKEYSKKHKCFLDFFSFHAYQLKGNDKELDSDSTFNKVLKYMKDNESIYFNNLEFENIAEIGDESYISETIKEMVEIGKGLNTNYNEYWITEWNSSMDCRDLVHDTCFMAAFIVKTCIESSNLVNGIGFWTFTDLFEEFRLEQKLFHGGFGLITYNGIKKASYHAFEFLNKLGEDVIYKEDGLVITKKDDEYQLLFYNYCHYNDLYRLFDYSQISQTNRYDVFKDSSEKNYNLALDLESGRYQLDRYRVNRDEGSAFDAWVKMGAPEVLSKDGEKYLQKAAEYGYKTWVEEVNDILGIKTEVLPHEIQLIIVKKLY